MNPTDQSARPAASRWGAILRQLCPRCLQGRVYKGLVTMHEHCPHCGLKFGREPGYFLGAMYYSYGMGAIILGILTALIWWLILPQWEFHQVVLVALVPFVFFVPLIFRYSRVIWMHFDHSFDPPAGSGM
jgi:uncharacterized protein (DUF983 family)